MKKNSKLFAVVLTAAMAVTVFSGCTKSVTKPNPDNNKEEKLTKIKWFQTLDPKAAATMKSYDEIESWKYIQEKTGVDIEWQHPPVGQETEQFNLMLASRDLPDVIYWNWSRVSGGPAKLIQDNIIINLNDFISKNAPNYKKVLDSNSEARKQTLLDDGSQYMFARLFPNPESMSFAGFQIKKDWLDTLGLKTPVTIDDWYTTLTAFKTQDPNRNGKPDEIPFLSDKGAGFSNFSAAWGVRRGFYSDPSTKKIKYGPIESPYKEFLMTMAKWYKEGLIDPEFASVDAKNFEAKMTGNKGGAYHGMISGNMGRFLNLMEKTDPKFDLAGTAWPTGAAGKAYSTNDSLIRAFVGEGAAITTSAKNPKGVAEFLDFCYGQEGYLLLNWGIEGKSYVKENGKLKMTELITKNPEGLPVDQAMIRFAFPSSAAPAVCDHEARIYTNYALPQQKTASKVWASGDNSLLLPLTYPTVEESSSFSNVMSEVNTYESEMFIKFVMGQESFDNFDKYVQRIKSMGIDKAIQIQQASLDRYNGRK